MKIALISPKGASESVIIRIPHGLLQLCAELKAKGHEATILDFTNPNAKLNYAELKKFDLIGLSVTTMQLSQAEEIVRNVGNSAKIVWGGVHCILDPLSILAQYQDSYLTKGEGEQPLLDIIEFLEGRRDIHWLREQIGVCFWDKGFVDNKASFIPDLNSLNDVNYNDLPMLETYIDIDNYYILDRVRTLEVLASRGCHWNCSFCINALYSKHGGKYRTKSIEKIRRETEPIIDAYGINVVTIVDEDFFSNKELLDGWLKYSSEKGVLWSANCRYNYFSERNINPDKMLEMADNGLFQVAMGTEAGDESIRNNVLQKNVKNTQIQKSIDIIKKSVGNRVAVNSSFIVKFPGDTKFNRIETIKTMDRLSRNFNIDFSGPQAFRPYPGSELTEKNFEQHKGRLDYYTNSFSDKGVPEELLTNETFFYTHVIKVLFSQRFSFFRAMKQPNGKWMVVVAGKGLKKRGAKRILIIFIKLLTPTIHLRLKLNYWGAFFEPYLIGGIARIIDRIVTAVQKIRR